MAPNRIAFCLILLAAGAVRAQQTPAAESAETWQPLDPIPQRLDVVKDDLGFYWQPTGAGTFYTMGANVFQSANQLSVNGVNFSASQAYRLNGTRHTFEGMLGEVKVRRDVWIDQARAGARTMDTFTQTGPAAVRISVKLGTDFSYNWQDLYSSSGKVLGADLGGRDPGVYMRFNPVDGQSDLWFLPSGEQGAITPKIEAVEGSRSLNFVYDLNLAPGQSIALVHWMGQRTLSDLAEIRPQFTPFYQQRRLIRPQLPPEAAKVVANFPAEEDRAVAAAAFDPSALVGVNRLLRQLEAERGGEELLWTSSANQLSGEVDPAAPIEFHSTSGNLKLALGELAVLRGGAGRGRLHEAITRDGEVYTGEALLQGVRMKGMDGWQMDLQAPALETLLLRVGPDDGRLAEGVWGFIEQDSGEILAVIGGQGEAVLPFSTPWGILKTPLGDVVELQPLAAATPRYEMLLRDGSRLTGFVAPGQIMPVATERLGAKELATSDIRGIWQAGRFGELGPKPEEFETDWENYAAAGGTMTWLQGGNRLAGKPAAGNLHLITGTTVTAIPTADIKLMRRTSEGILDRLAYFEIELSGGNAVSGRLREQTVTLETARGNWEVPVLHLLGYKKGGKP